MLTECILISIILLLLLKLRLKSTIGWCKSYTCLYEKTVIVTGGTSGIGFATALDFAKRGAKVIITSQNEKKGKVAIKEIIRISGNPNVTAKTLNLASFDSVRRVAREINETQKRLDILVNNAGVLGIGNERTEDGHLLVMQVNYYSHFLFTHLLLGKTVLVTGANTGIGFQTALDFAKRGARVILACRNKQKGNEARESIIRETDNINIAVRLINMASFESVRKFAKNINETEKRLDILVNNAGAGGIGDKKTMDGQIYIMQVNYYSSFLLTHLLLGLLEKTEKSRIINVASIVAKYARNFSVHTLGVFPGAVQVYIHSKLANVLFTQELASRLKDIDVTTYSLHPGVVKTDLFRHMHGVLRYLIHLACDSFFKTSEEGAQTTLYCSLQKGLEQYSGQHFSNCTNVSTYKTALLPGLAKKLWKATEEIVQLRPEEII